MITIAGLDAEVLLYPQREGGALEDGVVNVMVSVLQSQEVLEAVVTDGPSMLNVTKSNLKKQTSLSILTKL